MTTHHYVRHALQKIAGYDGSIPLHHYLRNVFRRDSRMGSRDRKCIRALCFSWFRCAFLFHELSPENRMIWSAYMCSRDDAGWLDAILAAGGEEFAGLSAADPISLRIDRAASRVSGFDLKRVFPFSEWVSEVLDLPAFRSGLLVQPLVWIRVNKGRMPAVIRTFADQGIAFTHYENDQDILSLSPDISLDKTGVIENGWAEVQDFSSGQTLSAMDASDSETWYDACAASGGKSLLLKDRYPGVSLVVSDVRESALSNLAERFRRNQINDYRSFVIDLTSDAPFPDWLQPDGIIADVPCSGSGTWSRSPEQMFYFNREKLDRYVDAQAKITSRLAGLLKSGGKLVYITCSVFREENEDRVRCLSAQFGFDVLKSNLIQGASQRADTLYCALLQKR